jgi:RND family efflux transporter MFP subunit
MKIQMTGLAVLATLWFSGCGKESAQSTPDARQALQAELVEVRAVEEPRAIEVQGVVQPERETFLSSRAMGPVVNIFVGPGDRVQAGERLLEIQHDLSHGQLAQAQGAKAQAEAALSLAERNYTRFQSLYEKNSCSELELDMARMQFEQAKGAVEQAAGAVAAASSVAEESVVSAPFDALVVEKLVNLGDLAAPGRPLIRLQSMTGRRLWLSVREADAGFVRTGMSLPVTLDSRPDLGILNGRVVEVVPAADMATHTVLVKVELGTAELMSGISGRAEIPGEIRRELLLPAGAVFQSGGLSLVTSVDAQGLARTRAVTVGASRGGEVEILSGLSAGDRVVAVLAAPIADGTPVRAN